MSYPHIAARIYEEPWLMFPARYQEMCRAFEDARQAADDPVGPKKRNFWNDKELAEYAHPQVEVVNGVALARVHGVTGKGLSAMAMQCGGFDTGLFREQLQNVAADPAVKALVIDFNTPGGMAAGNLQVTQDIRAVSAAGKRTIGYASGMCCSAGYFMGSACDELHAEPDAIVGSISTIMAGVDSSAAWAKEGLELKLFSTGKFKATGMPGKKWTEEEEKNIWERINKLDAEFKGFVAERRGLDAEHMEGQWWYARHAPAGLVDSTEFSSLSQVLEAALAL
jgi:signal peptide peptidase SppA